MVVVSLVSEKVRDMTGPKWLICSFLSLIFLLGQSRASAGKNKPFGDVTDEEVAIDHLEDYLQGHNLPENLDPNLGPHLYDYNDFHSALKLDEKIEFAVSPKDLRYFVPSSVLRTGELPTYGNVPSEDMIRKSSDANGLSPAHPPSPLLQELYSRFSPAYEEGAGVEGGSGGQNGFYKGHKFGPGPAGVDLDDKEVSESPERESVNFLQESRHQAQVPQYYVQQPEGSAVISDFYFVALVSGCTAAAVCAIVGAGICYLRLHKSKRDAADAEYPAYGVTGPCKDFSPAAADRKLAQSAHMFHYQHQKQQMIALEKSSGDERHCSTSDVDSEEEGEEGDYTVYECPGLAPTDEMEVKNPLFSDDPTPATPARQKKGENGNKGEGEEGDEEEQD